MSSGQSLRNGNSVEPGLPNTFLMPNARNRPKVASLTVMDLLFAELRDKAGFPHEFNSKNVAVMPGLVPAIHVLRHCSKKDVDGRDKPGHDENWSTAASGLPRSGALHGRLAF